MRLEGPASLTGFASRLHRTDYRDQLIGTYSLNRLTNKIKGTSFTNLLTDLLTNKVRGTSFAEQTIGTGFARTSHIPLLFLILYTIYLVKFFYRGYNVPRL